MILETLQSALKDSPDLARQLFGRFIELGEPFLLRSQIWDAFEEFRSGRQMPPSAETAFFHVMSGAQEATVENSSVLLAIRYRIARWCYVRVNAKTLDLEEIPVGEYLGVREKLLLPRGRREKPLEFDIEPFTRELFQLQETRSIGRGVEFLNRRLSSDLFNPSGHDMRQLLEFLRAHKVQGRQLMLNDRIRDLDGLRTSLRAAADLLDARPDEKPWAEFGDELRTMGFEPGWGKDAGRVHDSMTLLSEILEAPEPGGLERFLSRIPMIFNIVILSPHGYFAQKNVLGRPDTGGQVVYILDQVRALDKEMRKRIDEQGLDVKPNILVVTRQIPDSDDTTCDQRIEEIEGAQHARILRVPFRDGRGAVIPHWISRFQIWPYLERFALDVEDEVKKELGARPDLIIGNYSDGNLVATLLASSMGVTQCNISHALEKTKYLYSDLYWKDNDPQYHFSCQFTADLIAMNSAEFIVTSTYQEIAGTGENIGQYESYSAFPMPGLYRVVKGINVFDPKFNIVSPGANSEIYFPYTQTDRRKKLLAERVENFVWGDYPDARGMFADRSKPVLFTMARLDRIKNITGLVDWYGRSERLRNQVNLLVIAGRVHAEQTKDEEERQQIAMMHDLINRHDLEPHIRWLGIHLDAPTGGEFYRWVADHRGAFVQPALFEAFGLTVIEAMTSGLPTFATRWGGPLEIVQHGASGFHIDPNHGDEAAGIIADFFERAASEEGYWHTISEGAVARVRSHYTWDRYAERLMTLSRIYGFWKHVTNLERAEMRRYLEMFYALQFRPLAAGVRRR